MGKVRDDSYLYNCMLHPFLRDPADSPSWLLEHSPRYMPCDGCPTVNSTSTNLDTSPTPGLHPAEIDF